MRPLDDERKELFVRMIEEAKKDPTIFAELAARSSFFGICSPKPKEMGKTLSRFLLRRWPILRSIRSLFP